MCAAWRLSFLGPLSLLRSADSRRHYCTAFLPLHLDCHSSRQSFRRAQIVLLDGVARSAAHDPGGSLRISFASATRCVAAGSVTRRVGLPTGWLFRIASATPWRDLLRRLVSTGSALYFEVDESDHLAMGGDTCAQCRPHDLVGLPGGDICRVWRRGADDSRPLSLATA